MVRGNGIEGSAEVEGYRSVGQLNTDGNLERYQLVTDGQEIESICEDIGQNPEEWGSLFVALGEGEYEEIYGCLHYVPHLQHTVWRIYPA